MDDAVPIQDMADGDLGVVAEWPTGDVSPGTVVQRYRDAIILVGVRSGMAYTTILQLPREHSPKVHILPAGSHIRVVTPTPASTILGSWHNLGSRDVWQGNFLRSGTYLIDEPIAIEPRPPLPDSNS